MGASTGRKAVKPAPLPATFVDGLPDHVIAYVREALPKGLQNAADLATLLSRSSADVLNDRIDIKAANMITRRAGRLLRGR